MEIQITDLTKAAHTHAPPDAGLSDAMRVRTHTHTAQQHLLFLDPAMHPSWHREAVSLPPPPLLFKLFCCSLKAFYYLSYPDMRDFIKVGRYAYHELFWHWDLLIFPGNFFCPPIRVWSGRRRADAGVSEDQSLSLAGLNHPGDYNELWPQLSARISSGPWKLLQEERHANVASEQEIDFCGQHVWYEMGGKECSQVLIKGAILPGNSSNKLFKFNKF